MRNNIIVQHSFEFEFTYSIPSLLLHTSYRILLGRNNSNVGKIHSQPLHCTFSQHSVFNHKTKFKCYQQILNTQFTLAVQWQNVVPSQTSTNMFCLMRDLLIGMGACPHRKIPEDGLVLTSISPVFIYLSNIICCNSN